MVTGDSLKKASMYLVTVISFKSDTHDTETVKWQLPLQFHYIYQYHGSQASAAAILSITDYFIWGTYHRSKIV
jgi:hypothetical protein